MAMSVQEAIKKLTDAISTPKYPIVTDHVNDLVLNDSNVELQYHAPVCREVQLDNHSGFLYIHLIYDNKYDESSSSGWEGFHINNVRGNFAYVDLLTNSGNVIGFGAVNEIVFKAAVVRRVEDPKGNYTLGIGLAPFSTIPGGAWRNINIEIPLVYDGNPI